MASACLVNFGCGLSKTARPPTIAIVHKNLFARWRANFFTGLAVLLPAIASVVVVVWFFSSVANVTDTLLFFLPGELTHKNAGQGQMYWYWSLAAFVLAVLLISLIGRLTRYYIGKKIIQLLDQFQNFLTIC